MHSHLKDCPAFVPAIKRLEQLKPDQFEIYFEERKSTKIDSKDQVVDQMTRSEDVGLSIRLIKDLRLGFSYTTCLEKEAIEKAVDMAFEVARHMPEDPYLGLHSFSNCVYPEVDNYDAQGLAAPLDEKTAHAKFLEAACRNADPRVTGVRRASLTETSLITHLVDSNGDHLQHKSTGYMASITCKAEEGGDSQMGGEFAFSNHLDALPIQEVGKLSARWATELLGAGSAPTMKCPSVLRNNVVADLLEFLSESFSAEQIDKGRSMLANRHKEHIFSNSVSILNDGLLPGGMGTVPFDAEGVPSKRTTLVDGGFLTGTLFDSYYARKRGADSTGSSQRSIKSLPSIGYSNLYMKKGRKNFDTLVKGIPNGILITDLMGLHTANPVTGHFSLGASGILIENSKLSRPVRGFAIAGNILDLFRRVVDVGNDLKFYGRVGAPSILLDELSVGGA